MVGSEDDVEVEVNDGCKSMMAVSSRQIGHHTISGNISLFQIHQKLKRVVQRLQTANFVTKPKWLLYYQSNGPHFGASCIRPN